jgi:spermidine/putrescine transport system substrate-binding protein
MRKPLSGRVLAVATVLTVGLLASACGGGDDSNSGDTFPSAPPASQDTGQLKLLEWEGYQLDKFHPQFAEAHPDAKPKYQYASAGSQFFSKVLSGGVDVDIAHPCSNWIADWKKADLIAPIDVSKLSNWKDVDKQQAELGKIDGKYYYVPWDWGYESLIVNTDSVPGGKVPTSWADMWDPAYKGQISMENFGEGAVQLTSQALGLPYPNLSDEQLDQVKAKLEDLRPNIRTMWESSTDLVQQMTSGDVSIGYGWNDQYAKIKDAGTPVTYVNPKEGRGGWSCGFVVLKNTEHYNLALEYIDSAISTQACVAAINDYFLGCSNTKAIPQADAKTVKSLELDAPDIIAQTQFAPSLTEQQRTDFNELWTEVAAGVGG